MEANNNPLIVQLSFVFVFLTAILLHLFVPPVVLHVCFILS